MADEIRVLVVDDEKSFLVPLISRLKSRGFCVEGAASGPEAVAKVGSAHPGYDVALVDQAMGPPDGIETMVRIRQECPAIEVIVLTGWGDMEPGEKAMQKGAFRYRSKPIGNLDELLLDIRAAARLGWERKLRLGYEAFVEAGREISAANSTEDLYERLHAQARLLLPGLDSFFVALWNELNGTCRFPFCMLRGERQPQHDRQGYNGITEYVAHSKEALLLPNGDEEFRQEQGLGEPVMVGECASEVAVPMFLGGRVVGVLAALSYDPEVRYGQQHVELLQAFANQAAVTMQNVAQLEEARSWQQLDRSLSTCQDPQTAYRLFAEHARDIFGADLAMFYPYDPLAAPGQLRFLLDEKVILGDLGKAWETPRGGLGGAVLKQLDASPDGLLVVEDLVASQGRMRSRLSNREGIQSFVALRLRATLDGQSDPQKAGVLFLDFRKPTAFESASLLGLRLAGSRVAGTVSKLHLLDALQGEHKQLNRRLQAVVEVLQAFRELQDRNAILARIASAAKDALDVDVCTLLEWDPKRTEFTGRGAAGLWAEAGDYSVPPEYKTWFLDPATPTVIASVGDDERMRSSAFVTREGIESAVVYPLRAEGESLGLLFASHRRRLALTPDKMTTIGLFADLAATMMCENKLTDELGRTQKRLERRAFLFWLSMYHNRWSHSLIQKTAAIRNYVATLQRRLGSGNANGNGDVSSIISHIERLAADIVQARRGVFEPWDIEPRLLALEPLLEQLAESEQRLCAKRRGAAVNVTSEFTQLAGVRIRGRDQHLIAALEAVFDNARQALVEGGTIAISGTPVGDWAEVRISDSGPGIPEAIRNRLFRDLIPREPSDAGMGLGALLAATIIEEHEGTIDVERSEPGGTTVLIRLPVATEEVGE